MTNSGGDKMSTENNNQFQSTFGFLMAAVGSAVGVGNLWGFPYKMGANGGFAFLLCYIVLVAIAGFVIMVGELTIGRKTGKGVLENYRATGKHNAFIGYFAIISIVLLGGFCVTLTAYCMKYFVANIVEFARENGFLALAEGVETREEMNTVIRLGVDLIQGFYTARPNERFLDEIDRDVKNEITSLNLQTVESRQKKTYIVDKEQEIMLMPLVTTEHYTEFVINRRELSFVGNPRIPTDVLIRVPDNTVTTIHLRRVSLDSYQRHPCIEIGNNCDVTIAVEGTAVMNRKGIRVPESSRLNITGEGKLTIYGTGDRAYGIGGDSTQTIGRISVNMGGEINLKLDGKDCVGIGGGYSNEKTGGIFFESCKNLYLTISGERALGIGIANNTAPVVIRNARIKTEINADKACGIGSILGETDVTLKDVKINHTSSGDTQTAVGSLGSKPVKLTVSHVEMQAGIKAKTCVAIGCRDGSADIRIEGSELNLKCEGAEIVGIGTKNRLGRGRFERSVFNTTLLSADVVTFGYEQENMSFLGCTI